MKKNVLIVGAGWLGMDLAVSLVSFGFKVSILTRSKEKLAFIDKSDITGYYFSFQDFNDLLKLPCLNPDHLIVLIPPNDPNTFKQNMLELVKKIGAKHLIFASSTGVYADSDDITDEDGVLNPDHVLTDTEHQLKQGSTPICILRLGGLIGEDRHPAKYFAGKQNIPNGLAPVNLIHKTDLLTLFPKIIDAKTIGTYNVVFPNHPSRKLYYEAKIRAFGMEDCSFENQGSGKTVLGSRILSVINWNYAQPI